ncbi:hypothetical protein [Clostridioides sp. ZZV15-6597]|uniref:hypothetical protein n=1 Tax=Clostridioides sp. ZZV15-6597 TaxID=2811500 RepID=UPI001D1207AD|nr:hypothetical protein [Clostridioides sp. ZZV15-6597]
MKDITRTEVRKYVEKVLTTVNDYSNTKCVICIENDELKLCILSNKEYSEKSKNYDSEVCIQDVINKLRMENLDLEYIVDICLTTANYIVTEYNSNLKDFKKDIRKLCGEELISSEFTNHVPELYNKYFKGNLDVIVDCLDINFNGKRIYQSEGKNLIITIKFFIIKEDVKNILNSLIKITNVDINNIGGENY